MRLWEKYRRAYADKKELCLKNGLGDVNFIANIGKIDIAKQACR
jgi:hypothetical protein